MNVNLLHRKVVFAPGSGVKAFQSRMFHGWSDASFPIRNKSYGDALEYPLHLAKNVFRMSHVIQPHRNLVISETVKKTAESINCVDFYRVVFARLFQEPYSIGDWSTCPKDYHDMEVWLDTIPDVPELHHRIEPYYEIIAPRVDCINQGAPSPGDVLFNSLVSGKPVGIQLSKDLLRSEPITWCPEAHILSDLAFGILEPWLEMQYYNYQRIEVK
jgi:hypothetical protein